MRKFSAIEPQMSPRLRSVPRTAKTIRTLLSAGGLLEGGPLLVAELLAEFGQSLIEGSPEEFFAEAVLIDACGQAKDIQVIHERRRQPQVEAAAFALVVAAPE
jgi:hypothetical protein